MASNIRVESLAKISLTSHLVIALTLRMLFLIFGEIQDQIMNVKYTDVDYYVFNDAASYVAEGKSPFHRHTYRYTPLLAFMLLPNVYVSPLFGKFLFGLFDVLTGYLIFENCISEQYQWRIASAMFWWYNPLTIAVSTRGNAEAIMCTLVLLTFQSLRRNKTLLAGLIFGLAVHFKIYPVIYSLPIYFSLHQSVRYDNVWNISLFIPSYKKLKFVATTITAFALLTGLSYQLYGDDYLHESFLYHIVRRDTRHNFSVYFYMLYLNCTSNNSFISVAAFLPQLILIVLLSFKFRTPSDLQFCAFCQTFVFVTFNKVCTSQYFLWYLCLLPLVSSKLNLSLKMAVTLVLLWFFGQGMWLLPAYFLEMEGINTFIWIWFAGLLFFGVNLYILKTIIQSYQFSKQKLQD